MTIPAHVKLQKVTQFLKPYVLKIEHTSIYVHAQVIHLPTSTIASSASSKEKSLRSCMGFTGDLKAAAKIGKILGERLMFRNIEAVSVSLTKEQEYDEKVKAVLDSLREVGVKVAVTT